MPTTRFVRRSAALAAGVGTAAAVALVPSGAQAQVQSGFMTQAQASASYTGGTSGGACNLQTPDSDHAQGPVRTFTDGTKRSSVDLDALWTSSDNSADTTRVKGHVEGKLTVEKHRKDLKSFTMGVNADLTVKHAVAGSACDIDGSALGSMQVQFTEHRAGKITITRTTSKSGSAASVVLVNLDNGKLLTLDFYQGGRSHDVASVKVKPGDYGVFETQAGVTVGNSGPILLKTGALQAKVSYDSVITGEFTPKK